MAPMSRYSCSSCAREEGAEVMAAISALSRITVCNKSQTIHPTRSMPAEKTFCVDSNRTPLTSGFLWASANESILKNQMCVLTVK